MKSELHQRIGNEIRFAREAAGMTQDELAAIIIVPKTTISHWETGRRAVSVDNLYKLARALDCDPSDFMPAVTALKANVHATH